MTSRSICASCIPCAVRATGLRENDQFCWCERVLSNLVPSLIPRPLGGEETFFSTGSGLGTRLGFIDSDRAPVVRARPRVLMRTNGPLLVKINKGLNVQTWSQDVNS